MASFFVPLPSPATTTAMCSSSSLIFLHPKHIPKFKSLNHYKKITCKSTDHDAQESNLCTRFDRRNVLIGLSGLYGATTFASAAPIPAPDVTKCGPPELPEDAITTDCCPPPPAQIIDFELPPLPTTMSARPAAHLVDDAYIAKFRKAVELMRALPEDDPRSFKQQANLHCAYCNDVYNQVGFPDLALQIHKSWLFFPFHRCFLYFFEKILAKLINDPTFAIPFWNWDSPEGMTMPSMYVDATSSLYNKLRDTCHQPPAVMDLNFSVGCPNICPDEKRIETNLKIMYRQMVCANTTKCFFGGTYRLGDEASPSPGSIEDTPHNTIHDWTGASDQPNREDMGSFYSAARDPLFYTHHANIDRMWCIWKTIGEGRNDITDQDFLGTSFVFYDENAQMVRIKVQDVLDETRLGYVYQDVEIPWLNSRPTPRISLDVRKMMKQGRVRTLSKTRGSDVLPAKLDRVLKIMVKRPKARRRSRKEKDEIQEVLVVDGIEMDGSVYAKFDVCVNDEDDKVSMPENTEFAGSFVNLPHKHKHGNKKIKTQLRLCITDILEDLDSEDDEYVLVTLVPRMGGDVIRIQDVKIEFED